MKAEQMQPGTPVYDRTMTMIGTVARTWSPEGVINPPRSLPGGTFRIEVGTRVLDEGVGYFQLHRLFAPDWFIPFTDVAGVWSSYVILKVTEEEGWRSGWHIEPILYPTPRRASNAQTDEPKEPVEVPVLRYSSARMKNDEPARQGTIENHRQMQAALSWIAYWKATIADGSQHWLATEQAREEIMHLHRRIEDYRQRQASDKAVPTLEEAAWVA